MASQNLFSHFFIEVTFLTQCISHQLHQYIYHIRPNANSTYVRFKIKKREASLLLSYCRRPGSNRYGYYYPRDFKSRASASSATPAFTICNSGKKTRYACSTYRVSGAYRARTYDPLLVRQMLSQLS